MLWAEQIHIQLFTVKAHENSSAFCWLYMNRWICLLPLKREAIVLRGCSPRIRLSADLLITWRVTCTAPCWKLRTSVPKMQWHLKFAGLGDSILISRTIPGDRKQTRTQSIVKLLSSSVRQLLAFHWRWVNEKKWMRQKMQFMQMYIMPRQ